MRSDSFARCAPAPGVRWPRPGHELHDGLLLCRGDASSAPNSRSVRMEPETEADARPTFVHRKQYLAAAAVAPCGSAYPALRTAGDVVLGRSQGAAYTLQLGLSLLTRSQSLDRHACTSCLPCLSSGS